MKPLLVFLLLSLSNFGLKAQGSYITKTSSYIRESMRIKGYELTKTGRTDDFKKKYITFYSKPITLCFYFNMDEDQCTNVVQYIPKDLYQITIDNLNQNYIRISDISWKSFYNNFKILLNTEELPDYLMVSFFP